MAQEIVDQGIMPKGIMPQGTMPQGTMPQGTMPQGTMPQGTMPLSGYRVLQIGSAVGADYCGKLFADFGADVIKLEPAGGDPLRSAPPIVSGGESGLFAWLNTNKRSVTETDAALTALLPGADVVIDARPPAAIGASHD